MEVSRSLSMLAHVDGELADITDEVIMKPDLAALLSAEMPSDSEDYEDFDVDQVTESELSSNMCNPHMINIPALTSGHAVDNLVEEQQRKEEVSYSQPLAAP